MGFSVWNGEIVLWQKWVYADWKEENQNFVKGTVMQTEKVLINDRLRDSKVSWKFRIPTIHNFEVIYMWTLLFS